MNLFHDQQRDLLIYDVDQPQRILSNVKAAKHIHNGYVAVPRTLYNCQLLRWLDYPVLPVATDQTYDWPRHPSYKVLDHQRTMTNFMVLHPKSFNLSDMGTMKTLATLWAADFVMRKYPQGACRALITCPLSTLQRVWGDAIYRNFLGRRTYVVVHGDAKARERALSQTADFYIINFDGLGIGAQTRKTRKLEGLSKLLQDRTDIRIAIVDEASAYRDSRTKRHWIARQLLTNRDYLWLLTGTPTPNGPPDAYGLAKLVNNAFGESWTSYHNSCMMKVSQWKWVPRAGANERARQILRPSIRFELKDVWDGPECTVQQREVELTNDQKKHLHALKQYMQVELKSGKPITAVNEAAARTKYIQIALGAIYDSAHVSHLIDASPRVRETLDIIENAPGKIIIFASLTNVVNMLYKELKDKFSCAVVNGDVSQKARNQIFADFQNQETPRVLIADPGTMAHGLDLYAAQTVVWYGPTDKTELYLQANRRAYRPGQQHPVAVVQLVSNKLDREIFRRLEANESLQGLLLTMIREEKL